MPLSTKAGRTIKVKMDRVLCEIEDVYSDETRAMFIGIRRVLFFTRCNARTFLLVINSSK